MKILKTMAMLAVLFNLFACPMADEHCALVPCSNVCLLECFGDAGSSTSCTQAVAACEVRYGNDAGKTDSGRADAGKADGG